MTWAEASEAFFPGIRSGETIPAINRISDAVRALPTTPYHRVLDLNFTNDPEQVANQFQKFIRKEQCRINVAAVYTETNGFGINPDRWYFDLFAYRAYGGHDDYDWLAYWDSEDTPGVTLTGMEELQQVYSSDAFGEDAFRNAEYVCALLVVAKFQDLIRQARSMIDSFSGPLLATSHDYEYIAEFQR